MILQQPPKMAYYVSIPRIKRVMANLLISGHNNTDFSLRIFVGIFYAGFLIANFFRYFLCWIKPSDLKPPLKNPDFFGHILSRELVVKVKHIKKNTSSENGII